MAFLEKKKRKFGDRKDGHWVKDAPSLNVITSILYPNRCDNEVSLRKDIDVTDLLTYIKKKNNENSEREIKFFHCFVTALVRTINEREFLSRFVQGGRIYMRDQITVSFVAKRQFEDHAEEALLTYRAKKDDTINEVADFILGTVKDVRKEKTQNDVGKLLDIFSRMPRVFLILFIKIVRCLDYWGRVPSALQKGDPSYCTALVSNLGSIHSPSVYHHLNNYGTTSLMFTIGEIHKQNFVREDGSVYSRDIVDITATVDERIADGFYLTKSVLLLEKMLQNPEVLDQKFEIESNW